MDKKILIKQFIDHLRDQGYPVFQVDKWPDEENRMSPDIDAIAGDFAIEHTSVDTVDNQRTVTAWFMQALGDLKDELQGKLSFRLVLILPYEGIQTGQDWSKIKAALRMWILGESLKLSEGYHTINNVSDVPFEFHVSKRHSQSPRLELARFAPKDNSFPNRIREQLDRKTEKLAPYKNKGKITILLMESDDIALMNVSIMKNGIKSAYPDGLPIGIDQIWFIDTSIPEELLFFNLNTMATK